MTEERLAAAAEERIDDKMNYENSPVTRVPSDEKEALRGVRLEADRGDVVDVADNYVHGAVVETGRERHLVCVSGDAQ